MHSMELVFPRGSRPKEPAVRAQICVSRQVRELFTVGISHASVGLSKTSWSTQDSPHIFYTSKPTIFLFAIHKAKKIGLHKHNLSTPQGFRVGLDTSDDMRLNISRKCHKEMWIADPQGIHGPLFCACVSVNGSWRKTRRDQFAIDQGHSRPFTWDYRGFR